MLQILHLVLALDDYNIASRTTCVQGHVSRASAQKSNNARGCGRDGIGGWKVTRSACKTPKSL